MSKQVIKAASAGAMVARNAAYEFSFLTLFTLAVMLYSSSVFATESASLSGVAEVICSVAILIVFDIARGVATLAIIALGVAAMFGKASWTQAITIGVGIGIMFGGILLAPALTFNIVSVVTTFTLPTIPCIPGLDDIFHLPI